MARDSKIKAITLFVLVGEKQNRQVRRAPLAAPLRDELSAHFAKELLGQYPESHSVLEYVAGYKADSEELLEIDPFKLPDVLEKAFDDPASAKIITDEELEKQGRVLVAYERATRTALFQHFDRGSVLRRGLTLFLDGDTFNKQDSSGLVVQNQIHAVWLGSALRFRQFWWVSRIFEMTEYFEEASEGQVTEFLSQECFAEVKPQLFRAALTPWCRKKIKAVLDGGNLTKVSQSAWKKAVTKSGVHLEFRNGKIVLPVDPQELRRVLRLLDDDYLDSIVKPNTVYQTSSKRPVKTG